MTLDQELRLSYYREVAPVNEAHGVWLVQNIESRKFFVKKTMQIYNIDVYHHLKENPVKNTPRIFELFENGRELVVIEEYIPGETLEERLNEKGKFSEAEVIDITIQLCKILENFHNMEPPVVNRDLKPSNIKITDDGAVKLLDMNAAKMYNANRTQDTVLLGTKGYAAPEQYGFGTSNVQADIYAVGVLMNVMLTNHFPSEEIVQGKLKAVVTKCTELTPKNRYQSVYELRKVLERKENLINHTKSSFHDFLLPGFCSDQLLPKILSAIGYLFVFSAVFSLEVENANRFENMVYKIIAAAGIFAIILFSGNYRNIQSQFSITQNKNIVIRVLKVIAVDVLIFCVLLLTLAIFMNIFNR